jgi:hypothetical protein
MKRRKVTAKPGQIRVGWGPHDRGEPYDLSYAWGGDGAVKSDARMISSAFEETKNAWGRTLREELEHRGYDLNTLKFEVQLKDDTKGTPNE